MHAPAAVPTREAARDDEAQLPQQTVRVPIVCPPLTAHAFVNTPAPSTDRRLSRSVVSHRAAPESGVGLRVGDRFLGFELVEELGQGAFARVFLARQESLAGRPVALKVTLRPTREAERLARLQHTNVVPVYSVHNAAPVQVICMPYLGRRTVADVIRVYRDDHPSRDLSGRKTSGTRAARSTDVVDSAPAPRPGPARPPERPAVLPAGGAGEFVGDPAAVLGVLAQLAAGLAHAHARGILHLDLKPANVLLPDTGEAMLLDFNLAFDTTTADRELVGGTVPYMAIEQLVDLRTRGRGRIDARTDLYSLGVMAFEMLTGAVPFPASSKDLVDMDGLIEARRAGPPSVRELNPAVSPAVEAIVRKLLAPDPADRYQSAADLKTDVERHLAHLPLLHAGEPSLRERLGKWRRRNPRAPGRLVAAALFALVVGLGAVSYQRHDAAATAEAASRARATRDSLGAVRLDLVLPGDPRARARGVARAEELLAEYGLPGDARWADRPAVRRLSEEARAQLGADLGELMLLLAQAKWREADPRGGDARDKAAAEALGLCRAARTCFADGSTPPLLDRLAVELAFAAGAEPAGAPTAPAAGRDPNHRDLFLDAAAAIGSTRYAEALPLLERAVKGQPAHAAAQFCLAYCKEHLGKHESALERYEVAQSLLPKDARPAYQRGLLYATLSDQKRAEEEFTRAIALDPEYTLAYRNRGFAGFRLGRAMKKEGRGDAATASFKKAEADLTRALELGASPIQVFTYRHQVRLELGDPIGADADKTRYDALTPETEADFIARGNLRREKRDAEGALDDYRAAYRLNPRSVAALHNQMLVLTRDLDRPRDALDVADRMAETYPDYALGRARRALLLARVGKAAEAADEAEKAMTLSKDSEVTYLAACTFALASKTRAADRARAVELLDRSIRSGFRRPTDVLNDSDLEPLRGDERFERITRSIASLYQ
jgi:serine/threonine protein kinase/Tfp pilus assembly protein PilF